MLDFSHLKITKKFMPRFDQFENLISEKNS